MRSGARRGERGTTLLEALLAMVVVSIGFIGMIATNNIGVWMNGNARSVTRATAIADDLVEQMYLWDYNDARLADGTHGETDLTLGGAVWSGIPTAIVNQGVPFTRSWTVTRVDDMDANGVYDGARITINVSSTNGGRNPVSSSATVYLFKKNPAER